MEEDLSEKDQGRVLHRGRDLDRLVNFTDAVAAVAITVLVLPIADLVVSPSEPSVWAVLGANSGQVITFFFTFFVVAVMWRAHNNAFNRLKAFDSRIFWYNLAWLASIAFLPVTSNLYGSANAAGGHGWSGGTDLGGSGLLYWGSLGMVSIWGSAIAIHARRHPELTDTSTPAFGGWRNRYRGVAFAALFFSIGLVSIVSPAIAIYLPLGIIIVGRIMR